MERRLLTNERPTEQETGRKKGTCPKSHHFLIYSNCFIEKGSIYFTIVTIVGSVNSRQQTTKLKPPHDDRLILCCKLPPDIMPPKNNASFTAKAVLGTTLAWISLVVFVSFSNHYELLQLGSSNANFYDHGHRRLSFIKYNLRQESFAAQSNLYATIHVSVDPDPNEFAFLIIHYHKTGHDLSHELRDIISGAFLNTNMPDVDTAENKFGKRKHNRRTLCPNMFLTAGEIAVQAAPNFFCDAETFAEMLLRRTRDGRPKRGIKILHLVRNPFDMAVSNYNYHAQYPTPEDWIEDVVPCEPELFYREEFDQLILPTLSTTVPPIMTKDDVTSIHTICQSMYQTQSALKTANFFEHLLHLDPHSGLELATILQLTQPKGSLMGGGDIPRMANNIIKLKQAQSVVDKARALHHVAKPQNPHEEMIQVLTLSTASFIHQPKDTTLRLLEFAFGNAVSSEIKEGIAREYERRYLEKMHSDAHESHVTHTNINTEIFRNFLTQDRVFGKVLGSIAGLVDEALRESSPE
jgi:hypothetical protein